MATTADDVWRLLGELVEAQNETERRFQASDRRLLPRYQSFNVLGAVAGMVISNEVARYAYRQGLFVIAQSGESLAILNDANFKPKAW
ncbi:hypothetical protein IQ218_16265 [Synechocystis salina LEGE 06099]|uniref:hypothetical protein n=1 Tax=Synechocystis salina TaxID=945780 RepID=UPI001883059F|nr:hypothetical protein [Synechocystis salina]MBE9204698.1 hypothetical protein [Synechocystis salina LEGE 06099]